MKSEAIIVELSIWSFNYGPIFVLHMFSVTHYMSITLRCLYLLTQLSFYEITMYFLSHKLCYLNSVLHDIRHSLVCMEYLSFTNFYFQLILSVHPKSIFWRKKKGNSHTFFHSLHLILRDILSIREIQWYFKFLREKMLNLNIWHENILDAKS